MNEIVLYKDFIDFQSNTDKIRKIARKIAIATLSEKYNVGKSNNWIRFPYYHHVFNDERNGFERQLRYLKNFGEFISMHQACKLISGKEPIDGRYFCMSFDDGFKNCYTNMLEITSKFNIPVIIYLPTDYIGLDLNNENDRTAIMGFDRKNPKLVPFLNWDECTEMLSYNITFGSHTSGHVNLSKLNDDNIKSEMQNSKDIIEDKLKIKCEYFACPWGRYGIDFNISDTDIAKQISFKSFATTNRGMMKKHDDLFLLTINHLIANWENFQLKYFFFGK